MKCQECNSTTNIITFTGDTIYHICEVCLNAKTDKAVHKRNNYVATKAYFDTMPRRKRQRGV